MLWTLKTLRSQWSGHDDARFPGSPRAGLERPQEADLRDHRRAHVSGREVRDALYQYPIWEFELSFDGLNSSSGPFPG